MGGRGGRGGGGKRGGFGVNRNLEPEIGIWSNWEFGVNRNLESIQ
jgi:hypothetical protein